MPGVLVSRGQGPGKTQVRDVRDGEVLRVGQMCAWCEGPQRMTGTTETTGYVHGSVGNLLSQRDLCYPHLKV